MSDAQLRHLTDYVLEGYQWFCHKPAFDYGSVGRELTRPGALSTASMLIIIDRLRAMNAPRSSELNKCYDFADGRAGFQSPGNRHFWKADIMVHHGGNFYLSARIPSARIIGTEKVSQENLKRKYLAWGSTNILVDGREYWNVFPAWDWSRIPGVTTAKDDVIKEDPYANGSTVNTTRSADLVSSSDFAGGVSDGVYGLAAYDYSWDGIRGRKAYFFSPEAMYCFGAGITASKNTPVITNVDQCNSRGTATISTNGKKSVIGGDASTFTDLSWAHHNRVGYLFPAGGEVTVQNMDQTGSWSDISASQSATPVTQKIFSLWIDHGKTPADARYEYIVVPDRDLAQFEKWTHANPLRLITNSADFQSIHDKSSGLYGIAFYRPGTTILDAGLAVTVSRACLLLIQGINKEGGYKITVSDPTTKAQNLIIRISKRLTGPGANVNPDESTSISVTLPSGEYAGKSVKMDFSTVPASGSSGFENFKPGPLPFYY
jgi:chondroitin AC lyase